ncbi:unnamed protein product [Phytophthora fragariaefolia]|uniref:Unnamed protein product n=1 Tax=Phytophthora fragariaefolia TaxID=1490495 RepID=A0A9W6UFE6_9STRA|nr:unnamed protein product [Phytophthora fragariaefolia]
MRITDERNDGYGRLPSIGYANVYTWRNTNGPGATQTHPFDCYRLNRCTKKDIDGLRQFVTSSNTNSAPSSQEDAMYSPLRFYLVTYSEMYEEPQPSMAVMEKRVKDSLFSTGTPEQMPLCCAFTKEKSNVCNKFSYGKYAAHGIIYNHDQYWNKTVKIPSQASVLLLSSKLDVQTPHEYAEYLLETLDGSKKELVTFEAAIHGAIASTQLDTGSTCGIKILASYVKNKGNLKGLDKYCVAEIPAINLTVSLANLVNMLSTDDEYDGAFIAGLNDLFNYQ